MELKAGMQGVDLAEVNAYIAEVSKGTRWAKAQERRKSALQCKVDALVSRFRSLPATDAASDAAAAEALSSAGSRWPTVLGRLWVHVDMDAFYAQVEAMDKPELSGRPVAVGSLDMLLTSSYEARRFGVRAGMPGFVALQLCPQIEIVPPRLDRYREVSASLHAVFACYDRHFKAHGLDEVSLEITGLGMTGDEAVAAIRRKVTAEFGGKLSFSAGVAHTAALAKLCAQVNKPGGSFVLQQTRQAAESFLSRTPLVKLPGFGRANAAMLGALGIVNCSQVAPAAHVIFRLFSRRAAARMVEAAVLGMCDEEAPNNDDEDEDGTHGTDEKKKAAQKSVSRERTLRDFYDEVGVLGVLEELCNAAGGELHGLGVNAGVVILRIRDTDFDRHAFSSRDAIATAAEDDDRDSVEAKAALQSALPAKNGADVFAAAKVLWKQAVMTLGGTDDIRTIGVMITAFRRPK